MAIILVDHICIYCLTIEFSGGCFLPSLTMAVQLSFTCRTSPVTVTFIKDPPNRGDVRWAPSKPPIAGLSAHLTQKLGARSMPESTSREENQPEYSGCARCRLPSMNQLIPSRVQSEQRSEY